MEKGKTHQDDRRGRAFSPRSEVIAELGGKGEASGHVVLAAGVERPGAKRAEIVIVNSHNRSSAYQLHPGIFRFLCLNATSGTRHVAYVIGRHWLTAFQPVELPA